ncbi:MAG TPA: hypothetical protein PLI97_07990 [Fluviicola sp.]|nr:hypothetical protein [Fluviicola sp.]
MEFKEKIGKWFLLATLICWNNYFYAQILEDGERKGLVQATASIYPSQQLNRSALNIYIGGNLNVFLDHKYSVRGDVYSFISTQGKKSYISDNFQLQVGFMRFFPVKRLDPYVGLQVGLSVIQTTTRPESVYNALFALKAGLNYHVYHYFYFFVDMQYTHQADPWASGPFDQFMGTGGLGFQIPCKNVKQ